MAREQRLLKWTIRLLMPVMTLAGFGGFASLSLNAFDPPATVTAWSPGGKYRAQLVEVPAMAGCGSLTTYAVFVQRRWGWIKTGETMPLCFAGPPSKLTLQWTAPEDLSMRCHDCDTEQLMFDGANWGKLHYSYDLER